jgi:hypothetical protein
MYVTEKIVTIIPMDNPARLTMLDTSLALKLLKNDLRNIRQRLIA